MEQNIEPFKEVLKPLYKKLVDISLVDEQPKAFFCMQWGSQYFSTHPKILFIGRAVNGWVSDSQDVEVMFGKSEKSIFERKDQMQWVENLWGNKSGYNTNNSAFWRVIKQVSTHYHKDNWSSHIAWSNLCKVSPFEGGNPSEILYQSQLETNKIILQQEMDFLSPDIVILLTGESWANDYMRSFNNGNPTRSITQFEWNGYIAKLYCFDNRLFVRSEHPQGKSEIKHAEAILTLLNRFKDLCKTSQQ